MDEAWLDAPTCEGWWWAEGSDGLEIVRVAKESWTALKPGGFAVYATEVEYDLSLSEFTRWFGPLVPPS